MEHNAAQFQVRAGKSVLPAPVEALRDISDVCAMAEDWNEPSLAVAPGEGTFFDEHIDIRDPEGAKLTERILELYDGVRPKKRKRNRDTLGLRIRRLAANALRCHFFRANHAVLYFRGAATEGYADKSDWMQHGSLGKVADALADAGLFDRITGKKMPENSNRKSWASSYWATDALVQLAEEHCVTPASIERRMPTESLVLLYGPKVKAEFSLVRGKLSRPPKGKRICFEPTDDTQEWTAKLAAISAFYRQQEIGLGLSSAELDEWLAARNAARERKGAIYRLPETFSKDIYRVFNNGDEANPAFGQGGRLAGGWWMQISSELRKAITINGQQTTELDYSNCHPRMLYAQRGLDCEGDLYELPEIAACEADTGVATGAYRPFLKWLMQVLINGKRRPNENERPDALACPPGFTIGELTNLLEARHKPIADAFRTGVGLHLMRLESDIALEIVSTAMAEGWTALSIHDSFLTTIDQRERLKGMMNDVYFQRLGKAPIIKEV